MSDLSDILEKIRIDTLNHNRGTGAQSLSEYIKNREKTVADIKFPRTNPIDSNFDSSLVFQSRFENRPFRDFGNFGVMNEVDALNPTLAFYRASDEYYHEPHIVPMGIRNKDTGKITRIPTKDRQSYLDKFQKLADRKGTGELGLSIGTSSGGGEKFRKYSELSSYLEKQKPKFDNYIRSELSEKELLDRNIYKGIEIPPVIKDDKLKNLAKSLKTLDEPDISTSNKRALKSILKSTGKKILVGLPIAGAVMEAIENGFGTAAGEIILDFLGPIGDIIRPNQIASDKQEEEIMRKHIKRRLL